MNLRVARELNCDVAVSALETGPVSDASSSYRGGLETSIHSMTATLSRMRSPPRAGGAGLDHPMPPPAPGMAFGSGTDALAPVSADSHHRRLPVSGDGDVDDRVAIIISLQGEVERLEEQLGCERTARAELEAQTQEEEARRQEAMATLQQQQEEQQVCRQGEQEHDEDMVVANARLVRENTELRGKLLRATRVLGRLRYRRKEMEHLE